MRIKISNIITVILIALIFILISFSYFLLKQSKKTIYKKTYIQNDILLSNFANIIKNNLNQFVLLNSKNQNKTIENINTIDFNKFIKDKNLFFNCDSLYIMKTKKGYIPINKNYFENQLLPSIKSPFFKLCIFDFYNTEDKNFKSCFIKAISTNKNFGFFETSSEIVNYQRIVFQENHFYIFTSMNKQILTKELNDFAILINIILFITFIITIIFVFLFIQINTKIIKIQENTKKELELLRFNKLLTIEKLSQSIIHNINNPLTSIKGFLNLMEANEKEISEKYHLKDINKKIDYIIEQLNFTLNRSRRDMTFIEENINLNNLIDEILIFFSNLINIRGIQVKKNYDNKIPIIKTKVSDISLILENLIDNAIDAMFDSKEKILYIETLLIENNITIKIKDTGIGINTNDLNKIFDLYFTTKETFTEHTNKPIGTGIGLFSVKQTLKKNNWNLTVNSRKGNGAEFIVYIPIKNQNKK